MDEGWTKYNNMKPAEGFKAIYEDAKEYIDDLELPESMKMEEDEKGKLPPIPPAWLGLGWLMRGTRPVKGLY